MAWEREVAWERWVARAKAQFAISRGLAGQPGISAPTAGRDAHGGPSRVGVVDTPEPCLRGPAVCAKRLTAQRCRPLAAGASTCDVHAHAKIIRQPRRRVSRGGAAVKPPGCRE